MRMNSRANYKLLEIKGLSKDKTIKQEINLTNTKLLLVIKDMKGKQIHLL